MSSNFDDLRSSFEYNDEENEPVEEYDAEIEEEEYIEEEEAPRRNPLRLIILVLLVLALLCILCFFLLPRLPFDIPGISPVPPVGDNTPGQPTMQPTDEGSIPPGGDGTEQPSDGTSEPGDGVVDGTSEPLPPPGTTEPLPPGEGTAEPPIDGTSELPTDGTTESPTDGTTEPPGEGTAEPPTDGTMETPTDGTGETPADGTMEPPTDGTTETPADATTEPPVSCDGNLPPVADANGPYNAMQGKGQAVVIFDGSASSDPDGNIESYEWDFGDGTAAETGESVTHGYKETGTFVATLTVTDSCGATGQDTADVTIVGPTPPSEQEDADDSEESDEEASQENSVSVASAIQSASNAGTPGFCYRVQYGDTLFGISQSFDVPIPDLAFLNEINADYYVIEGQGLFIPTGQIKEGPNVYIAQPYDTLDLIAYDCGLTPSFLAEVNEMSMDASLAPDQAVVIPPWTY
ncbi:MAG: LysM peptidoglycan-binding domain-containing protein [Anaerolineae bacterium]|nr:LysM peptidoglycan-binding domain-containing protein [Anaerolineae bacterium]